MLYAYYLQFCVSQDWENATQVARAFSIGRMESLAVSHLMERVSPEMLLELKEASRCRGMRQWLTHDVIAKEMFNRGWSSGTGGFATWSIELSNDAENILATWLTFENSVADPDASHSLF